MDSMKWNPSVYHDLLRSGDGSPEGMIRAFFDAVRPGCHSPLHHCLCCSRPCRYCDRPGIPLQVGWPSIVSTADRRSLVADIHQAKKQHLKEMVERREIPLRTGTHRVLFSHP